MSGRGRSDLGTSDLGTRVLRHWARVYLHPLRERWVPVRCRMYPELGLALLMLVRSAVAPRRLRALVMREAPFETPAHWGPSQARWGRAYRWQELSQVVLPMVTMSLAAAQANSV